MHHQIYEMIRRSVLEAVTNKGLIVKYASKRLRADKEIMLAAIKSDKRAKEYFSDQTLFEDEDIKQALGGISEVAS